VRCRASTTATGVAAGGRTSSVSPRRTVAGGAGAVAGVGRVVVGDGLGAAVVAGMLDGVGRVVVGVVGGAGGVVGGAVGGAVGPVAARVVGGATGAAGLVARGVPLVGAGTPGDATGAGAGEAR
jgi:hypothetical protein